MFANHAKESEELSFALITNTLHPYQRHNISVLSLPAGGTYRFRYESSYLSLGTDEIANLQGKCGLLVLRDFDRSTFIPLRTFRCFRVEPCGEFVFLELEFLSFVRYEWEGRPYEFSDGKSPEDKLKTSIRLMEAQTEREKHTGLIETIVRRTGMHNEKRTRLDKLVIPFEKGELSTIAVDDRKSDAVTISLWSHLASLLGGIDSYRTACFYLLGSPRDLDTGSNSTTFQSAWRRGYKLYAGRGYALQVFQLMAGGTAPAAPGFTMKLTTLEKHILPMRSTEPVDGAYDRLEFYFYVLPETARRTQSVFTVECDQMLDDPQGAEHSVPIPGSLIHVLIKWTKWEFAKRRILPYVLFVVATIVWFYATNIANRVAHGLKPDQVQLASLFMFAIGAQNWGVFTGAFKSSPGSKA